MKKELLKGLAAVALLGASMSASAVQVYLVNSSLRNGSGSTIYSLIYDQTCTNCAGSGTNMTASDATWDWDAGTGVLSQTGGTLRQYQWIGSSTASGQMILGDIATGLQLNTQTASTNATTYNCYEGNFGATSATSCGSVVVAGGGSTIDYNVNGNAACENRNIIFPDTAGGTVFRGLKSWDSSFAAECGGENGDGNMTGRGALDMVQLVLDNTGSTGQLILGNSVNGSPFNSFCMGAAGGGQLNGAACARSHWLIFSTTQPVPVPAAAWLFGSAAGLLGWARRRKA